MVAEGDHRPDTGIKRGDRSRVHERDLRIGVPDDRGKFVFGIIVTLCHFMEIVRQIRLLQRPDAFCGRENIGVICYSPMGKGLLTGAFTKERVAQLSEKDHRSRDPRFQPPQLAVNLQFVDSLSSIAEGLGWTLPELSIAWVLRRPELTSAIVGARRPDQIAQTVIAGDRTLDTASISAIDTALADHEKSLAELGDVQRARV